MSIKSYNTYNNSFARRPNVIDNVRVNNAFSSGIFSHFEGDNPN